MSLLSQAFAAGLASIRAADGTQIKITQGNQTIGPIPAAIGETQFELEDEEGVLTTWTSRDYFVAVADLGGLQLAGNETVTELVDGQHARQFTVLAPDGKPVFGFSDPGQTELRIHTKETTYVGS